MKQYPINNCEYCKGYGYYYQQATGSNGVAFQAKTTCGICKGKPA
ncbi:MAG: hypothetical protein WC325_11050 [Candidatus Bathyarchaeia archaeon]